MKSDKSPSPVSLHEHDFLLDRELPENRWAKEAVPVDSSGNTTHTHGIMDVTVLFSDIRGFTTLSENMNPSSVFEMLNLYLSTQMEKIEEHRGVIEKLNGDEIMAIFQGPDMAQNALRCGNAIVDSLRTKKLAENADWIGVGIGINTGQVYGGSLGPPERKHYTVVGNTVNMAARFCGFAKKFQVVFGENTERLVEGVGISYRSLGKIPLKGISSLVEVFETLETREAGRGTREAGSV